ncbi:MAG: hypothetical protein GX241_06835 [Ruminococcaceae bacterium]|nr:hypothetical protein [Oscillospiraceae bacterium]
MKIKRIISIALVVLIIVMSLSACGYDDVITRWSNESGVDISGGEQVSAEDTHGGFHGDGHTLLEIKYSDDKVLDAIKENDNWKELPLSENLNDCVYESLSSVVKIPKIENGYYYFHDRHSDSKDKFDDTDLLERPSLNFTLLMFDSDNNTLYLLEFDT